MSVIMRYIGRRNCSKKDFSEESHLSFSKKKRCDSSPLLCECRKGFITQTASLSLNKKRNLMLDKK